MASSTEFTALLQRAQTGDRDARDEMFALVYDELRCVASAVGRRRASDTLQATAIVHEAWLKLASGLEHVEGRLHFVAVASRAMRQVLVDRARAKRTHRRGGDWRPVTLAEDLACAGASEIDAVALDDCLRRLSELNERHARVVELRVFGGMTIQEAAETLGVSDTTVESDWRMARAWLVRSFSAPR